jgi:hypothetical protein
MVAGDFVDAAIGKRDIFSVAFDVSDLRANDVPRLLVDGNVLKVFPAQFKAPM